PCLYSASAWSRRRFSSAIAVATCCLALASCPRMSTRIWLSIFSGSSAREMRSLMFDRMRVDSLSNRPILLCLAVRADLAQVRRERDGDAFVGGEELLVVEMGKLECLGHHDRLLLDAIGSVNEIGRIE